MFNDAGRKRERETNRQTDRERERERRGGGIRLICSKLRLSV